MHAIPLGLALFLALAIIAIGALYLAYPRAATHSFGLPLPEALIPLGDMLLVLAAKGSAPRAYGMDGVTAVVMAVTAIYLMMGVH